MSEEEINDAKKTVRRMGKTVGYGVGKTAFQYGEDDEEEILENYQEGETQSSDFANNLLPEIRKLSGCKDPMGVGTYTECTIEQDEEVGSLLDVYWEGVRKGINKAIKESEFQKIYLKKLEEKERLEYVERMLRGSATAGANEPRPISEEEAEVIRKKNRKIAFGRY